jgi:hypothetical protein
MEPIDIDACEETVEVDLPRLKRILAARDDATREFQRVKNAILRCGNSALRCPGIAIPACQSD